MRPDTHGRSHDDEEVRMSRRGSGLHFPGTLACLAPPSAPESCSSGAGPLPGLLWAAELLVLRASVSQFGEGQLLHRSPFGPGL